MFKTIKKFTSCFLVFCMLLSIAPMGVFASEPATIDYVSLGASNVNGYGLDGYLPEGTTAANKNTANVFGYRRCPDGSYVDLVCEALEGEGYTVNPSQLAISSMRVEELRVLLDESYYGDAYTAWRFIGPGKWFENAAVTGGLEALRADYAASIEDAELITVDIGVNNFGVYLSNQLASGGTAYDDDLSLVDPELAEEYNNAKAYVYELIAEHAGEYAAAVADLEFVVDAMAYALAGFCVNYDIVMEKIYTLNPDATVVAVSIQNLMEGLEATIPGIDEAVPFGELFGALVDAANLYISVGSPYSNKYLFADVSQNGRVEFFLDQLLAYDGNPASLDGDMRDCFDVYDDDLMISTRVEGIANDYLASELEPYAETLAAIYGETEPAALLNAVLTDAENGYAIIGAADSGAAALLAGIIDDVNALKPLVLEIAYDVVAEIMQLGATNNVLDLGVVLAGGYGGVEDGLLAAIETEVTDAISAVVADPTYEYSIDEEFFNNIATANGVPVSLVNTVATLGIRTSIGNSFYGHPNRNGHAEIAAAIIDTLENGTTGKEVVSNKIEALIDELNELIEQYGPDAVERVYNYLESEGYIAQLETAIDELVADLENPDSDLSQKIVAETDKLLAILEVETGEELPSGEEVIIAIRNYEETLAEIKEYIENDAEIQELIAEVESIIAQINDIIANPEIYIQSVIDDVVAKYEEILEAATTADYATCGENHYVAFAGTNTSGIEEYEYSYNFGDYIDEEDASTHYFTDGTPVADAVDYIESLDAVAKADLESATIVTYQTDAKNIVLPLVIDDVMVSADDWAALLNVDAEKAAEIKATIIAALKGEYADEGAAALNDGVNTALEIKEEAMSKLPDDWAEALAAEGAEADEVIETILETAYDIVSYSLDATLVDMVAPLAEELVFNTVAYLINNINAVEAIKAANPNALIAIVGLHNPVKGLMVSVDGQVVDLGEYVEYFIEATNVYNTIYAAASENVIFVEADETEIEGYEGTINIDTTDYLSLMQAIMTLDNKLNAGTVVTENGHNYIVNQLKAAITKVDHIDSNDDDICDKCGANLAPVTPTPRPNRPSSGGGVVASEFTVKFETNGGSAVANVTVKKNELLKEPVSPTKEGFEFAGWYTDKALTEKYDFTKPVTKSFTLYAKWDALGAEAKFADLNKDAWYYEYVKDIIRKGLMNGISGTEFAPNATLTRGMFVTVLHRIEGEAAVEGGADFTDVTADKYYANAVKWANANGIVKGITETEFAPDAEITREQMAAMIARYVGYKKIEVSAEGEVNYTDSNMISEYAKEAVNVANKLGILIGNTDGSFAPQKNATRAEAATLFVRLLAVLEK